MARICPGCNKPIEDQSTFCPQCRAGLALPGDVHFVPVKLVDRYRILKVLKSGGMGRVYKAWDTEKSRHVAIKEMLVREDDPRERAYVQKRYMQEVDLLGRLDVPGLPRLVDFFVQREHGTGDIIHYVVMDFIPGSDLEKVMAKRNESPLPPKQVVSIMLQLSAILACLHNRGIIYRDLKPSNVILYEDQVYLVDLGISRDYCPGGKGTCIGTPGYAAPEQYQGLSEPRSDVYSLGVLAHYLLTGENPEDPDSPCFDFEPIRKTNPTVPTWLDMLIFSMVNLKVDRRPRGMLQVMACLAPMTGTGHFIYLAGNRAGGQLRRAKRRAGGWFARLRPRHKPPVPVVITPRIVIYALVFLAFLSAACGYFPLILADCLETGHFRMNPKVLNFCEWKKERDQKVLLDYYRKNDWVNMCKMMERGVDPHILYLDIDSYSFCKDKDGEWLVNVDLEEKRPAAVLLFHITKKYSSYEWKSYDPKRTRYIRKLRLYAEKCRHSGKSYRLYFEPGYYQILTFE